MPLDIPSGASTILVRKAAFERGGFERAAFDTALNLTPEEFRVEGELIAIGPLYEEDAPQRIVEALESAGLAYFEDFFELPGSWPPWCTVFAMSSRRETPRS
ncbi:MAG TPA: hypothetical protein VFW98_00905 [Gemmatimonadaceae bacterium]|nr:hypothetical protein [Gemmatimonadaceae bacterium]